MDGNWENFNPFELVKNVTEVQILRMMVRLRDKKLGENQCLKQKKQMK